MSLLQASSLALARALPHREGSESSDSPLQYPRVAAMERQKRLRCRFMELMCNENSRGEVPKRAIHSKSSKNAVQDHFEADDSIEQTLESPVERDTSISSKYTEANLIIVVSPSMPELVDDEVTREEPFEDDENTLMEKDLPHLPGQVEETYPDLKIKPDIASSQYSADISGSSTHTPYKAGTKRVRRVKKTISRDHLPDDSSDGQSPCAYSGTRTRRNKVNPPKLRQS
ncbi:uncharacterized protein [Ambystoma mexicanum]|uniref:uncharacterized protein n=1 Tax=Ambystoma mexicanum TaxID=8296 RepID=UPI0037E89216